MYACDTLLTFSKAFDYSLLQFISGALLPGEVLHASIWHTAVVGAVQAVTSSNLARSWPLAQAVATMRVH